MGSSFPVFIPIVIVFAVLAFSCGIWNRCFRNRGARRAPNILNPKKRAEFEQEIKEGLERATKLRKEQETDQTRGTQVWFSRWVHNGKLRHWVVYTHHTKYELRLPLEMSPLEKLAKTVVSTSQFICQPAPWNHEDELMEMRNEYLEREGKPYAEGYYICLIGWTQMPLEEVNLAFEEARQESWRYNIFNNCQHFLRRFSGKILDPRYRAADYGWFNDNIETEYQELLNLPPTQEIYEYQLRMLQQAMSGASQITQQDQHRLQHAMHHSHQAHVQDMSQQAIQQQNIQMQNMQMQNQNIQMQNMNMAGPPPGMSC